MMNDKNVSILVAVIISIGVIISSIFIFFSFKENITESTSNIAELSTMNIYSEINNELTKPIYVALTMANDTFVENWLLTENVDNTSLIIEYLEEIRENYEYDSVFLVSANTLNYYHYDGMKKIISNSDSHDVWYYDFIASGDDYALDVDIDEITGELTIFVNAKFYDQSDDLVAVVGVGVHMTYLQEMISLFEEEFDLEAFLISKDGLVQSHSNSSFIESRNIFDESFYEQFEDDILLELNGMTILNNTGRNPEIITSRYVDEIDWYIIVVKETNVVSGFVSEYFITSLVMTIVVVSLSTLVLHKIIKKYQMKVFTLAKTDHLTLLLNRRGFDLEFAKMINEKINNAIVFMIDIDRFKEVNDNFGHVVGDKVLRRVAKLVNMKVSPFGKLSRWGGDEFTGILIGNELEMVNLLDIIKLEIQTDPELRELDISISIGYTMTSFENDIDFIIKNVDEALYSSKAAGGNTVRKI